MKLDFSEPGAAISTAAHVLLLALLILNFPWLSEKLAPDEMPEAVPIETITDTDFNQIMKGEKTSKDVTKEPTTKVDKVAEAEETHKEAPKPDAKREVRPPPPPKPAAPVPTPPVQPEPTPPPVPEPPPPPLPPVAPLPLVLTPPVPTPAPKPAPPAPVPPERDPDAEVVKPAPPPPKSVPKPPEPPKHVEAKPPKPVPKPPDPPKVVETRPPPKPHPAEKPRPVDKPEPDQVAKLIDAAPPEPTPAPSHPAHRAAAHPKPAPAAQHVATAEGTAEPTEQRDFDPTDISKILNAEPAGAPPSTGRTAGKTSSRGAASGTAPKMSPTQSDALDGLLADQFKQCWSYLGLDHGRYIPEIKVSYGEDGSLLSEPVLLNKSADPTARSLADSAMRAVRQCNPLHIPAQFSPFYDQWRSRILRFDPAEMSG